MAKYVAAVDQGTTSTRCMLFDHGGVQLRQKLSWFLLEFGGTTFAAQADQAVADDAGAVSPFTSLDAGIEILVRGAGAGDPC